MNDTEKPVVAESTYRFSPEGDITAYELALILGIIYSQIGNVTLSDEIASRDIIWAEVARHFTRLETVDSTH